jgi:hypothetical protein
MVGCHKNEKKKILMVGLAQTQKRNSHNEVAQKQEKNLSW